MGGDVRQEEWAAFSPLSEIENIRHGLIRRSLFAKVGCVNYCVVN